MKNEFRGNLVLSTLNNKKLFATTKETTSFTIPGISRNFFWNFRNFVIKFYIKICLVIMIFLFSSNKKLEKKTKTKTKKVHYLRNFKN